MEVLGGWRYFMSEVPLYIHCLRGVARRPCEGTGEGVGGGVALGRVDKDKTKHCLESETEE